VAEYRASRVTFDCDANHGEGWFTFEWPDLIYGTEKLNIDLDGHCSKANPFYSGFGIDDAELFRDRIEFSFSDRLAGRLQLERHVTIHFELSDGEYQALAAAIAESVWGG
jgi:hypothetical protein